MRYDGEKCPICGGDFKEGDDIVVCPDCGAPHHRECWKTENKCYFESLHGPEFEWKPSVQDEETAEKADETHNDKVCPNCGKKNEAQAQVCENCKLPFIIIETLESDAKGDTFIDGEFISGDEFVDKEQTLTVGEASVYIGQNKEKFIKSFLKAKFTKGRQNFNWAAFFLSPIWFFYRKIYSAALAFSGAIIGVMMIMLALVSRCFHEAIEYLIGIVQSGVTEMSEEIMNKYAFLIEKGIKENPEFLQWMPIILLLFVVINVIAGFSANKLYLEKIKKDTKKIKQVSPNPIMYKRYLFAKGGTSVLSALSGAMAIRLIWEIIMSFVNNL